MRLRLAALLVAASAAAIATSIGATPLKWRCNSEANQYVFDNVYVIDILNSTFDGAPANISGHILEASKRLPNGETVRFTINLESMAFSADGSAGTRIRGNCQASGAVLSELRALERTEASDAVAHPKDTTAPAPDQRQQSEPSNTVGHPNDATTPVPDQRAAQMHQIYVDLLAKARSGKMKYLEAAKQYQHEFVRLYPEQAANALMNEYLAYMAVVGEKVDHHKLTDTEAQYELAQKVSELQEREARLQAYAATVQSAAARKADDDAAAKQVEEQSKAREAASVAETRRAADEAAARTRIEEQRLELEQEAANRQQRLAEQKRNEKLLQDGLAIMFPGRHPVHTCMSTWTGTTWFQNCN